MFRFRSLVRAGVVVACATLASACYRVTVVSNVAPSATVVDKPWVNSFVYGLVPPSAPITVTPQCAGGSVSKVVTERSFLNGLVGAITWGIYTPMHVAATCGGGARSSSLGIPPELLGLPANTQAVAADAGK